MTLEERCGTKDLTADENIQVENMLADYRKHTKGGFNAQRNMGIQSIISIDVYFHIIHRSDGIGNVNDSVVARQIQVLNDAFGGEAPSYSNCVGGFQPPGINTPFRFILKGTTRTQNDAWFEGGNAGEIASELRVGDCSTLNIFTQNPARGSLGFAKFPISECALLLKNDHLC